MKKMLVTIGSSFIIDLILTEEQANLCYHSGDCEESIKIVREMPEIQAQFAKISEDTLRKVIGEIYYEEMPNEMDREWLEYYALFEAGALCIDGAYEELN